MVGDVAACPHFHCQKTLLLLKALHLAETNAVQCPEYKRLLDELVVWEDGTTTLVACSSDHECLLRRFSFPPGTPSRTLLLRKLLENPMVPNDLLTAVIQIENDFLGQEIFLSIKKGSISRARQQLQEILGG